MSVVRAPQQKGKLPVPKNPFAPWSWALIQQEAKRMVGNVFSPQESSIRNRSMADIAGIRAANAAAASLFEKAAPETQQAYDQAGHAVAGFAQGFSGSQAAREAEAQKANEDFARSQGLPTGAPAVDTGAAHDTMYRLEGYNPASGLEAQGAAARAYAEQQPGIQAAHGVQDVHAIQNKENQDLIDLAAKRPQLMDQVLNELFQREQSKANLGIKQSAQDLYAKQFGEKVRHDTATEQHATDTYNLQVQKFNQQIQDAAQKGLRPNSSLSRAYGYIVDQNGDPILANGKRIPVAQTGSGGGRRGQAYGKALKEALSLYGSPLEPPSHGAKPYQGKYLSKGGKSEFGDGSTNDPKKAQYDQSGYTFRQALSFIMDSYGVTRRQARRALIEAGWPPPAAAGGRGPRGPYPGTGPH